MSKPIGRYAPIRPDWEATSEKSAYRRRSGSCHACQFGKDGPNGLDEALAFPAQEETT